MYKVIEFFTDLHDNEHPYEVGDVFPRDGVEVTTERLGELASTSNRRGIQLIEKVEEPEKAAKPKKKSSKK